MNRPRMNMLPRYLYPTLLLLLTACSPSQETGPAEVRWDRDACDRCRMVLSDPHYAAEVRYFPEGKRSKIAKFDDIGCAVIWLQDKPWAKDDKTEIWVADYRNGKWIDAQAATYVSRKTTPMEYGLGAQPEPVEDGINFEQAKIHISEVEKNNNAHGHMGHAGHSQ